jgi:hypothetical protein
VTFSDPRNYQRVGEFMRIQAAIYPFTGDYMQNAAQRKKQKQRIAALKKDNIASNLIIAADIKGGIFA